MQKFAKVGEEISNEMEVKSGNSENLMTSMIDDINLNFKEKSIYTSSYDLGSQDAPYNPDDTYQKYSDYRVYEEMGKDDQVSVCLQLKKDLVLSSGWYIEPQDSEQEEMAKEIEYTLLEQVEGDDFIDTLYELLSNYDFGFSLTEKVFKKVDGNKIALKKLLTRHPNTWLIKTDESGNILDFVQRGLYGEQSIDKNALIHFKNNPKFGNPYGTSDLRAAYQAWFSKKEVTKYYGIFLEKSASPIPVAKYDKNAPDGFATTLLNIIKKFQNKTSLVIPKEVELQFLEARSNGEAYGRALDIFNMFIGRSLFVPDLVGLQGGEFTGGSFAASSEQIKIFYKHIEKRRSSLESTINKHIIKPIAMWNYGLNRNYPKFKLKPISEDVSLESIKMFLEAMRSKVYKPNDEEINYFRSIIKFPQGEVQQAEQPSQGGFGGFGEQQGFQTDATDEVETEIKLPEDQEEDESKEEMIDKKECNHTHNFARKPNKYEKKVNFTAIKSQLEMPVEKIKTRSEILVDEIFNDIYEQIKKKRILENRNLEKAETIKVKKLGTMNSLIKNELRKHYQDAMLLAQKELGKTNNAVPLPAEEFLKVLDDETFQYVGDWAYNVTKKTRIALQQAIKDGKPLSTVMNVLDNEGKKLAMDSLERYARTKSTEVLNRGRLAYFDSIKLNGKPVVTAYEYSAIMDESTSDICASLDEKIFENGTQPVPPMHFNCRSVLIPITRYEEYEPTKEIDGQPVNQFIEENIGEGFSVQ